VDILKLIGRGALSEDAAEEAIERMTVEFHSGRLGGGLMGELGFSEPEWRAWIFGVPLSLIASWRAEGWPEQCGISGWAITPEGPWVASETDQGGWHLVHPEFA
jgi:hypothetical protein